MDSQLIMSEDSSVVENVSYLMETEILPGTGAIAATVHRKARGPREAQI